MLTLSSTFDSFIIRTFDSFQVKGASGLQLLRTKISNGPLVLYHGSLAAASVTMVGHYPWFFTFNLLQERLPLAPADDTLRKMARNAFIGFMASVISDTISNSLRVIKTTRQTFSEVVSYRRVVQHVLDKDGLAGLFGRGLKTRILANGLQGLMFSVLWKYFQELQQKRKEE